MMGCVLNSVHKVDEATYNTFYITMIIILALFINPTTCVTCYAVIIGVT